MDADQTCRTCFNLADTNLPINIYSKLNLMNQTHDLHFANVICYWLCYLQNLDALKVIELYELQYIIKNLHI